MVEISSLLGLDLSDIIPPEVMIWKVPGADIWSMVRRAVTVLPG